MGLEKNNKKIKGIPLVMLIFALLGIVITLQIKSVAKINKTKSDNVSAEIKQYEDTIKALEADIAESKDKKDSLKSRYNSEMTYLYNNEKEFYCECFSRT